MYILCVRECGQDASKRRMEMWDGGTFRVTARCQNWGLKFGACSVFRKERGAVIGGPKLAAILGPKSVFAKVILSSRDIARYYRSNGCAAAKC